MARKFVIVKLKFPSNASNVLRIIDNQSVGKMVREAMRSAANPVKNFMKADIRTQMMNIGTKQSTGALERSIDIKYGRSRSNIARFYALVGPNKSHYETHLSKKPLGTVTKKKLGSRTGSGFFGIQHRKQKNGTVRSRQVFSTYRKNKYFNNYNRQGILKRKPSKYFHLVNDGFMHKYGVQAISYNFIERVTKSGAAAESQAIFERKLDEQVLPTIMREIQRKVDRDK